MALKLSSKSQTRRKYSATDYFATEEGSIEKHEYHGGNIRTMAGAQLKHNILAQRAARLIDNFVEEQGLNCFVSNSDTKIRIESYDKIVYPDAVVICNTPQYYLQRKDVITNPMIVVEILSYSTQLHDNSLKFELYRSISSFKEYVLIHQEEKKIAVYTRRPENAWIVKDYEGDEAVALLHALQDCPLPIARLYKGLEGV